jgi:hypothetical protein
VRELPRKTPPSPAYSSQRSFVFPLTPCNGYRSAESLIWIGWDAYFANSFSCGSVLRSDFYGTVITGPGAGYDVTGALAIDTGVSRILVLGAFGLQAAVTDITLEPIDLSVARRFAAGALNHSRDEVVFFGGENMAGQLLAETLVYDVQKKKMLRLSTPKGQPVARKNAAMAYDPRAGVAVLHGGFDGQKTLSDTWTFDGAEWKLVPENKPIAREKHSLGYLPERGLTMMGGAANGVATSEALQYENGWVSPQVYAPKNGLPPGCSAARFSRIATAGSNGETYLCDVAESGPTPAYRLFLPNSTVKNVPEVPFAADPLLMMETNATFGVTLWLSSKVGKMYRFDGVKFIETGLEGLCTADALAAACVTATQVAFHNGKKVAFPAGTPTAQESYVWSAAADKFIVSREDVNGNVKRFEANANGTIRELPGPFPKISSVIAAAVVGDASVVFTRTKATVPRALAEVQTPSGWAKADAVFEMSGLEMFSVAKTASGSTGFESASYFGTGGVVSNFSPLRVQLVTSGMRPTVGVVLPPATGCSVLTGFEVEGQARGEAGGETAVAIYPWNGFDFSQTPGAVIEPSASRPKTRLDGPIDAYQRFGYNNLAELNPRRAFPIRVQVSTVGKTKGPFDGRLTVEQFQVRYRCRQ